MLHCRGGAYYTGHTDNLDLRIAQHQSGDIIGWTSDRLPVELVWSDQFSSRIEALEAERRIKGWSRAKKQALIRGDWNEIWRLARSKNDASTSSARTVLDDTASPPVRPESVEGPSFSSFNTRQVITGTTTQTTRLDRALAEATDLSRERIKALIAAEDVTVAGTLATTPSAKTPAGTPFAIALPPATEAEAQPQDIPLTVAYEDEHLIVIDKPAGMVVHPAAGNADGTLVNALLHHCRGQLSGIGGVARPGIVHRIDKDTSGLLVAAKTTSAHEGLVAQFADHSIHRRYLAICNGHPAPPAGTISGMLGRSSANRKKMAMLPDDAGRGKHAVTHYETRQRLDGCSLIACTLETGRTHQIRVHCASIGHSLTGDPVYGRTPPALRPLLKRLDFTRQALHAAELGFEHPITGERVDFTSNLPPDMQELIDETARSLR